MIPFSYWESVLRWARRAERSGGWAFSCLFGPSRFLIYRRTDGIWDRWSYGELEVPGGDPMPPGMEVNDA